MHDAKSQGHAAKPGSPAARAYSYAALRVVPRVERDEFLNAGVILFSAEFRFLEARVHLDPQRLQTLWPDIDLGTISRHLGAVPRICAGDLDAGAIARLSQKERFHWLTAPRSTTLQISPVRSGLTENPAATLIHLMRELVA